MIAQTQIKMSQCISLFLILLIIKLQYCEWKCICEHLKAIFFYVLPKLLTQVINLSQCCANLAVLEKWMYHSFMYLQYERGGKEGSAFTWQQGCNNVYRLDEWLGAHLPNENTALIKTSTPVID